MVEIPKEDNSTTVQDNSTDKREDKICEFYEKGECWFGNKCKNKHRRGDQQTRNKEIASGTKWDKKKVECRFYKKGNCRKGQKCEFLHKKEGTEMNQKERSGCKAKCRYGQECRNKRHCKFEHEEAKEMDENNIHFLVKKVVAAEIEQIRKLLERKGPL